MPQIILHSSNINFWFWISLSMSFEVIGQNWVLVTNFLLSFTVHTLKNRIIQCSECMNDRLLCKTGHGEVTQMTESTSWMMNRVLGLCMTGSSCTIWLITVPMQISNKVFNWYLYLFIDLCFWKSFEIKSWIVWHTNVTKEFNIKNAE